MCHFTRWALCRRTATAVGAVRRLFIYRRAVAF